MSEKLEQLFDMLPEPALLVSGTGEVVRANSAAAELTGFDRGALTHKNLAELVTDAPGKLQEYLRLCSRTRHLLPLSFGWLTKDAKRVEIRCDCAVIQPRAEGSPAVLFLRCRPKAESTDQFVLLNQKIAALSKEIIERRKAEQQRDELLRNERAARVEAERVSRMKDEFLATLSHELRTPLNSILGYAQLLHETETLTDETRRGLEVIQRNARVQARLIEDLIDMSRIISGKIRLEVQHVELIPVIEAAIEAIRPAAEARSIRIQTTMDPLAGPVKGDPARIQQIVWNLLSNAVKFTPKGGRVQVFLERVNSHVEIVVSDTGEGIRPEFLPHVFDRFEQADASTTRRHGGLGLGLSIVKHLAELHGGSVRAKSPGPGQGSTFTVVLPLLVLHEERAPSRSHPASRAADADSSLPSLAGVRVLVVDDEPDARDLIQRMIAGRGAVVRTAESASDAMEVLRGFKPDVVVSDIGMPGTDGYQLMRMIRSMEQAEGGRMGSIALTAFASSQDRTRSLLAGFNIHLSKPIEPPELIAAVASLAERLDRR